MLQESKLNKLIASLNKLNHHILIMHNVIDTYVDVLMDLDPNSLEFVTDSYHKESLKYGELQKEIISLISSVETTEKENTIRSIVEYCESLGCFKIASDLEQLRVETKENANLMDQKHSKMINLLLFASSCNADTLKDIYSLADNNYKAYDASGQIDMNGIGIGLNHQV